ncbi:MAG TPA: gliding motility-associated C-terminal domain-containing protein [Ferruginibacter sp.]|nr:gliding motility-associated C-terminal domain-containing protein [Ferruginibacter sp.]
MRIYLSTKRSFYLYRVAFISLLYLCCPSQTKALNYYWVGDGGNWSSLSHWATTSGGNTFHSQAPTALDDVFFDANSFSNSGQSVSMNESIGYCRNMNWTGATNVPTFVIQGTNLLLISGSLTLVPAMHIQYTSIIILNAKTPGHTVTTAGHLMSRFWFNGIGGEWTLQDTFNSDYAVTLSGGTLNTNDQTINAVEFSVLGFYTPKSLNIGSSVFNLSGRNPFSLSNDGLSVTSGASVINLTNDTASFYNSTFISNNIYTFYDVNFSGNVGFITGPLNFHNVTFNGKGEIGESICTFNEANFHSDGNFYGSHSFHDLNFTAGHNYQFKAGTTQTISNRWNTQGTCTDSIKLKSDVPGSFASIKKLTDSVKASYNDIRDIHCTGGATFMAYQSADQGGNAGWNFANLPPLSAPGPVNGPTTVCFNASGIVFHTSPQPGVISYQWTVPAGASIVSGQGDTLIVVDFGSATSGNIEVFSSNSCQFSTIGSQLFVTVSTAPVPTASLGASTSGPICQGVPVIFTAIATGAGSASVSYQFNVNGNSVQNSSINSYTSSGLSNGDIITCIVTVSGNSCFTSVAITTNPVTMQIEPLLTPSVTLTSGQGNRVCPATVVSFHATANDIGNGNVNYLFAVNGIAVQNSQADTYAATVHNNDVISCVITVTGGSCYTSTSATSNAITMQVDNSAQLVQVNAGADVKIFGAQPVQLNGSGDAGTYLWTPPTGLSASNILNPVASPAVTTIYTLTITNANGCSASDFTKVEVDETGCPISVVNAITPNGDGINDKLIISTGNCSGYTGVTVFNRYGSIVFKSKQYQNDWQGTYNGKPLPDGTYYAVITYQSSQGKIISKRTDLTILR